MKKETKNKKKTTIKMANFLAPIISSRDIANDCLKEILKSRDKIIELDFTDVAFISRSAAHELLLIQEKTQKRLLNRKKISFVCTNKNVEEMFNIVAISRVSPSLRNKIIFRAERISIEAL
jgi:anti-anti-sigma regulatory factor